MRRETFPLAPKMANNQIQKTGADGLFYAEIIARF